MITLNKEKYLQIADIQGVGAAVTALHKEIEYWEHQTFEGKEGYRPDYWLELEKFRDFSRALWDLHLRPLSAAQPE